MWLQVLHIKAHKTQSEGKITATICYRGGRGARGARRTPEWRLREQSSECAGQKEKHCFAAECQFFCGDELFFFFFLHDVVARQLARRSAGHVRAMQGEEGCRVTGPGEVAQSAARREETGPNLREAGSFLFEWGG